MSVKYPEIRSAIERVENIDMQMFVKAVYLFAARAVEIAGEHTSEFKIRANKKGKYIEPYGLKTKNSCFIEKITFPDISSKVVIKLLKSINTLDEAAKIADMLSVEQPVAIFQLTVSKQGLPPPIRLVALPLDENYEPWTKEIYDYIKGKKDQDYVFQFNRQAAWDYFKLKDTVFQGKKYIVGDYIKKKPQQKSESVEKHARDAVFNGLRRARAMELTEKYSFDPIELSEYIGLQFDLRGLPLEEKPKRVCYDKWQLYINKLFKPLKVPY